MIISCPHVLRLELKSCFVFYQNSYFIYFITIQRKSTTEGRKGYMTSRFGSGKFPSIRNIMTGLLLSAGPIATLNSVKKSSRIFLFSVSKNKFEIAANRLQSLNLGTLQYLRSGNKAPVWVKKLPVEVAPILAQGGCDDLCNVEEYAQRFELPCPMSVTEKMKDAMVAMGLVSPELFKNYDPSHENEPS